MTTLTQCQQQVLDILISYQQERGFLLPQHLAWLSEAFV